MLLETTMTSVSELRTDLLVMIIDENTELFSIDNEQLKDRVNAIKQEYIDKKRTNEFLFSPYGLENIGAIVTYSTSMHKGATLWESVKMCVADAIKLAKDSLRYNVTVLLNSIQGSELVGQVVESALLSTWQHYKYKKNGKDDYADIKLTLDVANIETAKIHIEKAKVIAAAVNEARLLTIEPGDVITPETMASHAKDMADKCGLTCDILHKEQLIEQNYMGIVKVGSGSIYPPCMATITYTPEVESDVHLVVVGKGLCFDSGGISIKPASNMHEMKSDKAGAAAVIATMRAIAELKPSIKVSGIIVCAENMPDGRAQRPGDIITYKNGISVHVENTDAEGRLCLADGLIHAGEIGATHIIDIATLTGACVRALGESFTGIMGINRRLIDAITKAGGNTGESYWKLPLPLEYREMLDTPYADLTNSAGPLAGATTAGLFLKEFVPDSTPWVHLDIAGTAWHDKTWKYYVPGPTGVGVRTFVDLACNWNEYLK